MDLIKIGEFIASKRKQKNLTQLDLANKLYISDRAVSKWERGKSLPDSSIMIPLCNELGISVNELLSGEELEMKKYDTKLEENLINLAKQKEDADKRLLRIEIVTGITGILSLLILFLVGTLGYMLWSFPLWAMIVLYVVGFIIFISLVLVSLRIEQKAGYYECAECHEKYVPSFFKVLFAPHVNRTRHMKCPYCGKRSWHKKVISK